MIKSENNGSSDEVEQKLINEYKAAIDVDVSSSTENSILDAAKNEIKNDIASNDHSFSSWQKNLSIAAVLTLCVALTGHFYDQYGDSFQTAPKLDRNSVSNDNKEQLNEVGNADIKISTHQSPVSVKMNDIAKPEPGVSEKAGNVASETVEINSNLFSDDLPSSSSIQTLEDEIIHLKQEVEKLELEKRRLSREEHTVEEKILTIRRNKQGYERITDQADTSNDGYNLDEKRIDDQLTIKLVEIVDVWNAGDSDNAVGMTVELLNNNKNLTIMDIKEYLPKELINKIRLQ